MNETQYRAELTQLLNTASKTNDAGILLSGLGASLASILALVQLHPLITDDDALEIARHQLDLEFVQYSEYYKNATRKTA